MVVLIDGVVPNTGREGTDGGDDGHDGSGPGRGPWWNGPT